MVIQDDKVLYENFLKGDQKAFETLVLTYKDNLIFFIRRYVTDIHTCEDIAQDCFAAVFVNKDRYNFKVSFKTYLFAIAKNKAIDYIRKTSKVTVLDIENQNLITEEDELFNKVVRNDEQKILYEAIDKLNEDYQKIIYLVDLQGLSYKEAGQVLGKTLSQVKILVFRARKSLKKILEKGGYTNEN